MLSNYIKEIQSIKGNTKGILFLTFFRLSQYFSSTKILRIIGFPLRALYKLIVQWFLGIDIPDTTSIGLGLNIYHGQSLIINKGTLIGRNVTIRHNSTIGVSEDGGGCPIIGNNVIIGANVVIIGPIEIGDNSIIGAGSVVIKNVPPNSTVVGNPAKVIKQLKIS